VAFSVGGDKNVDQVVTVANILRKYNPSLTGFSTGKGNADSSGAHLNVAVTGARWQDLDAQVTKIVSRMRALPRFEESWKLISILIGPNNLCDYCKDKDINGPEAFGQGLEKVLDRLKAEVPRLFVNVMTVIDITELKQVSTGLCSFLHGFECACAVSKDPNVIKEVAEAVKGYNRKIVEISKMDKFNDDDDFAIVVQPFLQDTQVPRKPNGQPDTSYLAPDCFHFSGKGHAAAAIGLWNNLVEPMNEKKTSWVIGEPIECPEQGQFLYTQQN